MKKGCVLFPTSVPQYICNYLCNYSWYLVLKRWSFYIKQYNFNLDYTEILYTSTCKREKRDYVGVDAGCFTYVLVPPENFVMFLHRRDVGVCPQPTSKRISFHLRFLFRKKSINLPSNQRHCVEFFANVCQLSQEHAAPYFCCC